MNGTICLSVSGLSGRKILYVLCVFRIIFKYLVFSFYLLLVLLLTTFMDVNF